jgi:uncharacterized protein (TIGR03435 family)
VGVQNRARRLLPALALAICAYGQTADTPSFEVASIKLADPPNSLGPGDRLGCGGGPGTTDPGMWVCAQVPVSQLIRLAYHVEFFQIKMPDSGMGVSQRFNVHAKIPPGTNLAQFRLMQQRLLAERFKLALHEERRDSQVYELTVAKSGLKMKAAAPDAVVQPQEDGVLPSIHLDKQGYPVFPPGVAGKVGLNGHNRWTAYSLDMEEVVSGLAQALQQPVTDATGLQGKYNLDLWWITPSQPLRGQPVEVEDGPELPRAIQEQLGLKLESKKGQAKMLVIDHVEKLPVEN